MFAKIEKAGLFSGSVYFVTVTFTTGEGSIMVADTDLATAMNYLEKAAGPISAYCSQYGPNSVNVDPTPIAFSADLAGGNSYNDATLQGWVNQIMTDHKLNANDALVFLSPQGVVNTDADITQGVLGYHGMAQMAYSFVNVLGNPLTLDDAGDYYATALSHEIAEMTVDPAADNSNPEVCDPCVLPETLLLGDNKPISDYQIGDAVLGRTGLQTVTETFCRDYDGPLVEVKAMGMFPLRVTPNHPLLVVENTKQGYSEPHWVPADIVRKKLRGKQGDYLLMPKLKGSPQPENIDLSQYILLSQVGNKQEHNVGFDSFPVNKETAWLLGIYVAEGWTSTNGKIGFALCEDEDVICQKIENIMQSLFGLKTWIDIVPNSKGIRLNIGSGRLALLFADLCGHGASHKKIPDCILYNQNLEILEAFLRGYIEGDGSNKTHKGYEITRFTTISPLLARQLQLAYGRFDLFVSLDTRFKSHIGTIQGRRVKLSETYEGAWVSDGKPKSRRQFGDHFYVPIKQVSRLAYKGNVLNIETTDSTYLVSNIITHNCAGNCSVDYRNAFDDLGNYLGGSNSGVPGLPAGYAFFTDGVVIPSSASACPAAQDACVYAPVASPSPSPTPSPTPSPDNCVAQIKQGLGEIEAHEYVVGVKDIIGGLECLFAEYISSKDQTILRDVHALHGRLKAIGEKIEQAV